MPQWDWSGMSDIWTTLAARGRLATLNIGRPRASVPLTLFVDEVTKKRTPDEILPDLGVTTRSDKQRQAVDDYIKVGYKVLLPPRYEKAWRSAETGARRTILRDASDTGNGYIYAFSTPFGPFIPIDNLTKWEEAIEVYRKRYMGVAKALIKDYDDVRREVVENFTDIAKMTYTNLVQSDPALVRGITSAAFVERYIKAVKAYMPTPHEISRETYFRWTLRDVALPEEDRKQAIADAALRPEEKERIRTLNRAIEIAVEASKADLAQFEIDVNQQLLSVVYNSAEMAYRYLNAGSVPPKMSLMLDNLITQVNGLNAMDNKDVVKWATDLRSAIQTLRAASPAEKESAYDGLTAAVRTARDGAARRLARYGGVLRATQSNRVSDEPVQRVERRQRGAA
jgi:hypothetical protein